MKTIYSNKINGLRGEIIAPSDKSISQRAIMLSSLAKGKTRVYNFLESSDTHNAITAFRNMGIKILKGYNSRGEYYEIVGKGIDGLEQPKKDIYLGNSGTTMRLLTGVMSAQKFNSVLSGDESLSLRPMKRILNPLRRMGARLEGKKKNKEEYSPLKIRGGKLNAITYEMRLKSAQVKSAVLLAGIYAKGKTKVSELLKTRDHTERMLKLYGANITVGRKYITLHGNPGLKSPREIIIPGDISSAAFFIVGATIIPNSKIIIRNVGLNPTRSYIIKILERMGASIKIVKKNNRYDWEPAGDIQVESRNLKGVTIKAEEAAYAIDELPILCVAAAVAKGTTRIRGASELRIKETDRIYSMVTNLKKMGVDICNDKNDLIIQGPCCLKGARVKSYNDHRTAMCMVIAGGIAVGRTTVTNTACIDKSFPDFMEVLKKLV
ncbi:MAG: 3-phosphoshikimate 1-carboxyvinyltransferase [Candidatus Heimdallarchaeota archaeon]|nr:3-phosphoshikimate 1-carboxyvinyltransferase [Candidatus Heimdallarchaeota archaeon]